MAYLLQQTSDGQYKCPYCDKTWPTPVTNRVIRERPLNAGAKQSANEAVKNCPHLKNTPSPGTRRVTMERHDYPCRRVWVDAYLSYREEDPPPDTEPDDPVAPCPDKGELYVKVLQKTEDSDRKPLAGATVTASGPETRKGTTDEHGRVNFFRVKVGDYTVKVSKKETKKRVSSRYEGQGKATVVAKKRAVLQIEITGERYVPLQWVKWEKWSSVEGAGTVKIRGRKIEKRVILERMAWLPVTQYVTKTTHSGSDRETAWHGGWQATVSRVHATYGPRSERGVEPPSPGHTERSFGGYVIVHPSWADCTSRDKLLNNLRPGK